MIGIARRSALARCCSTTVATIRRLSSRRSTEAAKEWTRSIATLVTTHSRTQSYGW